MPYIKSVDKLKFHELERAIVQIDSITPGELNYLITMLCKRYIAYKGLNYTFLNDAIGALECAKQELYRRIATPYEDKKINENGDVYE